MPFRIPPGDDWQDHAVPCPHCDEPVLRENEHKVAADWSDPGYWTCDPAEKDED